jgi:hypothetical protein
LQEPQALQPEPNIAKMLDWRQIAGPAVGFA